MQNDERSKLVKTPIDHYEYSYENEIQIFHYL